MIAFKTSEHTLNVKLLLITNEHFFFIDKNIVIGVFNMFWVVTEVLTLCRLRVYGAGSHATSVIFLYSELVLNWCLGFARICTQNRKQAILSRQTKGKGKTKGKDTKLRSFRVECNQLLG